MTKRILIATITNAHGIKGWVKLRVSDENAALLKKIKAVWISENGDQTLNLNIKAKQKNHYLAQVDGVNDRNAAEALKGTLLYAQRSAAPALADNEYYHTDLIGLAVQENKDSIGSIQSVDNFGAGDLLNIALNNGQNFILPLNKNWVGKIDVKERSLELKEGWKDFLL